MFKENKYTKWYFEIINNAKQTKKLGYTERHHIVPRCLGGRYVKENLVYLTAREHFICHLLLVKMHDYHGLKFALLRMLSCNQHQQRKTNSRWYEYIKRLNSEAAKIRSAGKGGYHKGKSIYHNPETSEEKFIAKEELIPEGWIKGWSPKRRKEHTGNKGKIGYVKMGVRINLEPGEVPPEGFIRGGLTKNGSEAFIGSGWYYSPITGEEEKTFRPREGWISGRSKIWITNGEKNKQINFIQETMPENYWQGISNNPGPKHKIRKVHTPLGTFDSPWRFCEQFGGTIGIFDNLDGKFNTRSIVKFKALGVDLDPNLTKRQLGFYFL